MNPRFIEAPASFPQDDYTPHGYLDNPFDAGPSWSLAAGGPLRSIPAAGYGWFDPRGGTAPRWAGLRVGLATGEARLLTPDDVARLGIALVSRYHTTRAQSFDAEWGGLAFSALFFLAGRDALACRWRWHGAAEGASLVAQLLASRPGRRDGRSLVLDDRRTLVLGSGQEPWLALHGPEPWSAIQVEADGRRDADGRLVVGAAYTKEGTWEGEVELPLAAGAGERWLALGRGATPEAAARASRQAARDGPAVLVERLAEDDAFWSRAPRLAGDWPAAWRRGWVYDLETTRLMVRPPAGVFGGPWPTWSLFWPRVVLAENALDMSRLACAAPELAQQALLTMLESAAAPNLPCMWPSGVLDMVAADGSACGTSPAWCLPLHNLWLTYLWHPDRAWLARVYPRLADYVEWWLEHRRDADGWIVYKCTWEAGEDATPRLDPGRSGHADVAGLVRPAELQAALALSAAVLARMARELGRPDAERSRWEALFQTYQRRTRACWDEAAGRFRDQYPAAVAAGQGEYWDAAADVSALHLIPLLDEIATPEQRRRLAARLPAFNRHPWTSWPSWAYVLAEAGRAAGRSDVVAELCAGILGRVWPENDRCDDADLGARPGTAREWWPPRRAETTLNESYGWGATTATLFLRHVVGLSPDADTSAVAFELRPGLPPELGRPGSRLGIANLHYRGVRLDLSYLPRANDELEVEVALGPGEVARQVAVWEDGQAIPVRQDGARRRFAARPGGCYRVQV